MPTRSQGRQVPVECAFKAGEYVVGDAREALQGTEYSSQWDGDAGVFEALDGSFYAVTEMSASPSEHIKDSTGRVYIVPSGYIGMFPSEMCDNYRTDRCMHVCTTGPLIFSSRNGQVRLLTASGTVVIDARSQENRRQDNAAIAGKAAAAVDESDCDDYD